MWNRKISGSSTLWIAAALLAAPDMSVAETPPRAAPGAPPDGYHFTVEIEGRPIGGFASVSGLSAETEVVEYRSGSEGTIVRKLPGRLKFSNIVIRRPYVGDDILHEWVRQTLTPAAVIDRRNGAVFVRDTAGNEVARYHFFDAWPCKWTGPGEHSGDLERSSEEVVLCIDWFEEG